MSGAPIDPSITEGVSPVTTELRGSALTRASWPAIFAGVVLVLAIEVLLAMLGAGIGLGLVNPNAGQTPDASSFGLGAGLWWLGSTILALVFGCYVAARLAGVGTRFDGVLHGLVIWGLALLITMYLLTSAIGGVIGGAFSTLRATLSATGQGLGAAAPQIASAAGITPDVVQQQARAYLQPTNPNPATMNSEDAQKEIARLVPDLAAGGDRANQAKNRIIAIMAAQLKISKDEAAKRFDEIQSRFAQIRDRAAQTAKTVADKSAAAASYASLGAFVVLLIGAIAAGHRGRFGVAPATFLRSMDGTALGRRPDLRQFFAPPMVNRRRSGGTGLCRLRRSACRLWRGSYSA